MKMPNSGKYGILSHIVSDLDVVTKSLNTSFFFAKIGRNSSGVYIRLSSLGLPLSPGIESMYHGVLHLNTASY